MVASEETTVIYNRELLFECPPRQDFGAQDNITDSEDENSVEDEHYNAPDINGDT